jgi:glutaminyl-peptide cyclotransferase
MNARHLLAWLIVSCGLLLVAGGLLVLSRGPVDVMTTALPPGTLAPALSSGPAPTLMEPAQPPAPTPTINTLSADSLAQPTPDLTLTPLPAITPTTAPSATLRFDGQKAYAQVLAQVAIGPRPTGSPQGWATGDYIIQQLKALGWTVETQEFVFRGVKGRNVIGKAGRGPVIILGAHYDTRPAADMDPDPAKRQQPILGADDGGSGVAVLLELARVLDRDALDRQVWLAFFDAEDRGRLDGWPFSVGARQMAQTLTVKPQAVVVVDMVGDADQAIYYENNSDQELSAQIWAVAARLGYGDHIIAQPKYTIIDDHLPFKELGIPAVDMIDFDYPYWHTLADTADKVSPTSLERVGRTLEAWLAGK